jgi:hypothetical protein|tara:strand:+ start:291 stop:725 length:435 start_codon:yes stop_codon:yes gene_type:complete
MGELSKDIITAQVANLTTAGTSAHNSSVVDMSGAEGVRFVVPITAALATSVVTAQAYEGATTAAFNATSGTATITATTDTSGNNTVMVVDVYKPNDRYVQLRTTRATANATLGAIVAEKYGIAKTPVAQDSSVIASSIAVSPTT